MTSQNGNPKRGEWIWIADGQSEDSYGEFYTSFSFDGGGAELTLSVDSDYSLFVNGRYVSSDQYKDFPYAKVFDRIDIAGFLTPGTNHLAVVVWFYGVGNSSYYPGKAGLWFELRSGERMLSRSGKQTLSRKSRAYASGLRKVITSQLGFGFRYDAAAEDGWKLGNGRGLTESVPDGREIPSEERPVLRQRVGSLLPGVPVLSSETRMLLDLGREEVGYLSLAVSSQVAQTLTVSWGEHIADGGVRRRIGGRDFSSEVAVGAGETDYINYFRRLGLRYLEITGESPFIVRGAGVLSVSYPVNEENCDFGDEERNRIYRTAVRTLRLCMHDHYEDCPWREQALYAMDGRNQMLSGYYAFREYRFPRANLRLMSLDRRPDGLLSICTPDAGDLTIPSFSLHYFTEVLEYTEHSGDLSLAREILPKLRSVMAAFLDRERDRLVPNFEGKNHWNFYEWTDGLAGKLGGEDGNRFDAALNCLLSIALRNLDRICRLLGEPCDGALRAERLNRRIREVFYSTERRLYRNRADGEEYSELVNSLAILSGASSGEEASEIARELTSENGMTRVSVSMQCFKYDALLLVDPEQYRPYILNDISATYRPMLDAGATSFWETERGESDFGGAGSLCHGWSAMPVYYYHKLLPVKQE